MPPTANRLRELFHYDRKTGIVTRRITLSHKAKKGSRVGGLTTAGYLNLWVDGGLYQLHRLIWCMETGAWPVHGIDHRDGVRSNNRWRNLREATTAQNHQNKGAYRNNTTGITGVTFNKKSQKYAAQIQVNGKNHHLGLFDNIEDAAAARAVAKERLHPFSCRQ